jgi:TRAP-type C4-dicarboxylate transport system permease small subunit
MGRLVGAAVVGFCIFTAIRSWNLLSEAFREGADSEPIVYVLSGGFYLALSCAGVALGLWILTRRPRHMRKKRQVE